MKTLFAKIFLWFWASLALLVLVSYVMTRIPSRDPEQVMRRWGDPFRLHAEYAREALAREGRPGLLTFLGRISNESRLNAFVVDEQGRELRGKPMPEGLDDVARDVLAGRSPTHRSVDGRPFFAYPLGAAADVDSSVLLLLPSLPRRHGPPWPPHDASIIVVLIALGGVLCYALARHVSAPLARLRAAVANLASGDLSARVDPSPAIGGDEFAALGRDFNRMAERLEALVATNRRLLRDVSHELRSPLARIRVAIGLAQQSAGDEIDPVFARIERELERLETLIGQVLTLSRLEAGSGELGDVERFDLTDLVRGIAEDASFEAAAIGSEVRLEAGEPVFITGEPSLLHSAIENVVRNALGASPNGSVVEIEIGRERPDGSAVLMSVLDRGPGVPQADLETIFQPFARGEESRDRRSGGAGLGLAIARRAIEAHGGTIRASLREGGGLVVEMVFPGGEERGVS